jgi:hypothetical protein
VSIESSKVISRKSTRVYKRALWASPVAVFLVLGLAHWLLDRPHVYIDLISVGLLAALYLYFLRKMTKFHTFADEVLDCGDHLQISKGRIQVIVPVTNIARASLSPGPSLMSTVIVEFIQPTEIGMQIEFPTEDQSKTDFAEARAIAEDLSARAVIARTGVRK